MKNITKIDQPTEVVDIFCNKCGMSCKSPLGDFYGLIEAEVAAGYHSTHLKDGDVHKFSLCEGCLKTLFDTFKYSSFHGNFLFPPEEDFVYDDDFDRHKYFKGVDFYDYITANQQAEIELAAFDTAPIERKVHSSQNEVLIDEDISDTEVLDALNFNKVNASFDDELSYDTLKDVSILLADENDDEF